jgi:hypothetical protein
MSLRLTLDACVLYPTVMREVLLAAAGASFFRPVWSERLLEEWARAAARRGPVDALQAQSEIALCRAAWPEAAVPAPEGLLARLWLPDANDLHVLATAIASGSDGIVTVNTKDFPRHILAEEGLTRNDPDALLCGFAEADPAAMQNAVGTVLATANDLSDTPWTARALLKKARLPRLGKRLDGLA